MTFLGPSRECYKPSRKSTGRPSETAAAPAAGRRPSRKHWTSPIDRLHLLTAPSNAATQAGRISNFRASVPKLELAPKRQSMKVIPNAVSW